MVEIRGGGHMRKIITCVIRKKVMGTDRYPNCSTSQPAHLGCPKPLPPTKTRWEQPELHSIATLEKRSTLYERLHAIVKSTKTALSNLQ